MYLGNNYLRAFHGEWGLAWPRLQIVLLCPSWVSTVRQEALLSPRAKLLVPSLACPQLLLLTFLLLQDLLLLLGADGERWGALAYRRCTTEWLSRVLLAGAGDGGKAGQILTSPLLSSQHYLKQLKCILRQSRRLGSKRCRAPPHTCWVRLSCSPSVL